MIAISSEKSIFLEESFSGTSRCSLPSACFCAVPSFCVSSPASIACPASLRTSSFSPFTPASTPTGSPYSSFFTALKRNPSGISACCTFIFLLESVKLYNNTVGFIVIYRFSSLFLIPASSILRLLNMILYYILFLPFCARKTKNSGISHLLSLVRCLPLSDFYFIYVCFRISDSLPVCSRISP